MSRWQDESPDLYDVEFEFEQALFDSSRQQKTSPSNDFSHYSWLAPLCAHQPQCVLKSTEGGWSVFAGAGPDCISSMSRFDVLLNLTGESLFRRHTIPIPQLAQWEGDNPMSSREIVLDWPDMGIVNLPRAFWMKLVEQLSLTNASMLVFCVGGHGRTGTAIASLMVACGWASADAIGWVRSHYCGRAIETDEQEQYIRWIAGEVAEAALKKTRKELRLKRPPF